MPVRRLQSSFLVQPAASTLFAESRLLTAIITSVCVCGFFLFSRQCSAQASQHLPVLDEDELASSTELPLLSWIMGTDGAM